VDPAHNCGMSAVEIIEAIKALPPEQRAEVVQFAVQYEPIRKLTAEELGDLAAQLARAQGAEEAAGIGNAIINGFYGAKVDA
jgi:hypothetical protein